MTTDTMLPLEDWVIDGHPSRARRSDAETSHQAADSNHNRAEVEAHVYALLRFMPMNDWELTQEYFARPHPAADPESPRKRRSDLLGKGLIVATKDKRPGRSGRASIVWTVAS